VTSENVPARPAATVLLVREAREGSGIEVLMMRRAAGAAFAGGMYVFPGGAVDDADGGQEVAAHVDGLDDAIASATLGVERGGLAYWVAAIRECFEEAGVLIARTVAGGDVPVLGDERWAVHRGELSMAELCRRHGVRLDAGALRYVAHWVTPAGEARRRFDTRFFLGAAPDGQDGIHDDAELVDSRWFAPSDALAAAERAEVTLMPPTIANLRFIAGCASVSDALASAGAIGPPPRIEPRIRRGPDGKFVGLSFPGDPDYDSLA
jgi:8-oxo-dGTP pyrophosphatase MutT (NUDIX family)